MVSELQRQTTTIPIVFTTVSGSVESGFVASLARPGANITGFQNFEPAIADKLLGLVREAVPNVSRVGVLLNPDRAIHVALLDAAEAVAPSLGIQVAAVGGP
jgi:putative tryptophan/tyrosine transport system substrate-binding protein